MARKANEEKLEYFLRRPCQIVAMWSLVRQRPVRNTKFIVLLQNNVDFLFPQCNWTSLPLSSSAGTGVGAGVSIIQHSLALLVTLAIQFPCL